MLENDADDKKAKYGKRYAKMPIETDRALHENNDVFTQSIDKFSHFIDPT